MDNCREIFEILATSNFLIYSNFVSCTYYVCLEGREKDSLSKSKQLLVKTMEKQLLSGSREISLVHKSEPN